MSWPEIMLLGCLAVSGYDAVASWTSRSTGIPYSRFIFGSAVLYIVAGYLVARTTPSGPLLAAAVTGLLIGLTDSTLGWAISWRIGPGRLETENGLTAGRWFSSAIFVMALAAAFSVGGAVLARVVAA